MEDLHVIRQLEVPSTWIQDAVTCFTYESHLDESINKQGFIQMTLEVIAKSVLFGQADKEFWIAYDEKGVVAYAIGVYTIDLDNQMTYHITQAWIRPDYRDTKHLKEWYKKIKLHAQEHFCKHIVLPSSRGVRAYKRLLSRNLKEYMVVLKEDI